MYSTIVKIVKWKNCKSMAKHFGIQNRVIMTIGVFLLVQKIHTLFTRTVHHDKLCFYFILEALSTGKGKT